jgi:hypothetical protein
MLSHLLGGGLPEVLLLNPRFIQWIGLREKFNRKAPYLMGKSMVSG